jgi:hypothetical protein
MIFMSHKRSPTTSRLDYWLLEPHIPNSVAPVNSIATSQSRVLQVVKSYKYTMARLYFKETNSSHNHSSCQD